MNRENTFKFCFKTVEIIVKRIEVNRKLSNKTKKIISMFFVFNESLRWLHHDTKREQHITHHDSLICGLGMHLKSIKIHSF